MHPIDKLCEEFETTRYQLAKKSGIRESTLSNLIVRSTPIENMKLGTLLRLAEALEITIGVLIGKLLNYEKHRQNKNTQSN